MKWQRSDKQAEAAQVTLGQANVKQTARWRRFLLAGSSLIIVLALGVVTCLFYVAFTGIHYVILESTPSYDQAVRRAAEINQALESGGETSLRASAHHPRLDNSNCAILAGGPHFSKSAAEETLRQLKSNPKYKVRPDARVLSYTISSWR